MRWTFWMALAVATLPVTAFAQAPPAPPGPSAAAAAPADDRRGRQIVPFLERSYLFESNESDLVFEAAVFPHLTLWQNFDDLVDARVKNAPTRVYWALSLTPGVHLKMFKAFSDPVRTPSYMPRIDLQRLWSTNYRDAVDALANRSRTSVDIWEMHAAVRHHSNGQDGCLYLSQARDGNACVPSFAAARAVDVAAALLRRGDVNKHDGSFSTNDVRAGMNFRRTLLSGSGVPRRDISLGAEYQRQVWTDPDVKPFYAQNRVNVSAVGAWANVPGCSSRLEAALTATIGLDHPFPIVSRYARAVQVSCFPSNKGGFGLFVKWYAGQDDYNLGFLDNISRIQVGITFNQDGFFRFRTPR